MATVGSQRTIRAYRFGPYEVELGGELRKFGTRIRLQKKPFQLLLFLLERNGQIVTRSEIRHHLWPDVHVDFEKNLNIAVKKVRDALCDSADTPKFIETIAGQGYRFIREVEVVPHVPRAAEWTDPSALRQPAKAFPRDGQALHLSPLPQTKARRLVLIGAVVVAILLLWGGWKWRRTHLPFKPHDFVLITNFENRTGDPSLNGALETGITRELSNSRYVSVAPRERVYDSLRLMGKPLTTPVDVTVGREICLRDGEIKAMLTGGLQKVGSKFEINIFVINPVNGVTVATFDERAEDESRLLTAVHRATDSLRNRLGENLASIQVSGDKLQRVTTPSLAALQLYSRAADTMKRGGQGNQAEAEQELRQAINHDPQFASALMLLAWTMYNQGRPREQWVPYAEQAYQLAHQQTDLEALFIKGSYYLLVQRDKNAAIAAFEAVGEAYPDDYWSAWNAFVLLMNNGRESEGRIWSVRAADLRPNDLNSNAWAWVNEASLSDPDAKRIASRIQSLVAAGAKLSSGPEVSFRWAPVVEKLNREDVQGALTQAQEIIKSKDVDATDHGYLANLYVAIGRLHDAEAISVPRGSWTVHPIFLPIRVAMERNDLLTVRNLITQMQPPDAALSSGVGPIYLARAGYVEDARRLAELLPKDSLVMAHKWMEGEIALAEGRVNEAIHPLREVVEHFSLARQGSLLFLASEGLARALERSGDLSGAIKALEPLEKDHRFDYLSGIGPTRQRFYLAQLYRKTGRVGEARRVESELLNLLSTADSDYPLAVALRNQSR